MSGFSLKVQIEVNGRFVLAGHIHGTSSDDAAFRYHEDYICSPRSRPISLSLSLAKREYDAGATRAFFDGLLPEGFTRQCVAATIQPLELVFPGHGNGKVGALLGLHLR